MSRADYRLFPITAPECKATVDIVNASGTRIGWMRTRDIAAIITALGGRVYLPEGLK